MLSCSIMVQQERVVVVLYALCSCDFSEWLCRHSKFELSNFSLPDWCKAESRPKIVTEEKGIPFAWHVSTPVIYCKFILPFFFPNFEFAKSRGTLFSSLFSSSNAAAAAEVHDCSFSFFPASRQKLGLPIFF